MTPLICEVEASTKDKRLIFVQNCDSGRIKHDEAGEVAKMKVRFPWLDSAFPGGVLFMTLPDTTNMTEEQKAQDYGPRIDQLRQMVRDSPPPSINGMELDGRALLEVFCPAVMAVGESKEMPIESMAQGSVKFMHVKPKTQEFQAQLLNIRPDQDAYVLDLANHDPRAGFLTAIGNNGRIPDHLRVYAQTMLRQEMDSIWEVFVQENEVAGEACWINLWNMRL